MLPFDRAIKAWNNIPVKVYIMVRSGPLMKRWSIILYNTFYLVIAIGISPSTGGACWMYIDDTANLCKKAFGLNMTYEECCGIQGLESVSWTPHDISSNIFYWNFLSKGATMCHRCHKNCSSVLCEQGKTCRMVDSFPVCVCKSHCDTTLKSRGALCGTDGRKYRNICALQRYNCVAEQQISVEYFGKCRDSCKRVECETGKHCLQDQNGTPHCVSCHKHCNMVIPDNPADYMCGENGKTYRNTCELKADICKTGRSIRISHSGKCFAHETCKTLVCPSGTTCLVSAVSGKPICMNCNVRCIYTTNVPICGTDKRTYSSYCNMLKSGCHSGVFVSTFRRGPCRSRKKRRNLSKAKLKVKTGLETNNRNAKIRARKHKRRRHRKNRRNHKKSKRAKHKKEQHHRVLSYKTLSDTRKSLHVKRRKVFQVASITP